MSVATFSASGTKSSAPVTLDKKIFELDVKNHDLLKRAYESHLANGRVNSAKTKKRGEVRGGGRKPIRQKGTGNARVGSTRNPIWTGGGVAFGPTGNENYSKRLSKQSSRLALRQALSLASKTGKIIVIEDFSVKSGKTNDAAKLLAKIEASERILLVLDSKKDIQAIRNLNKVKPVQANYLNVYDVLNADKIIFTKPSLALLGDNTGTKK